jgi:hypothetical protein
VSVSTKLGNPRGYGDNVNDDLNIQSVRDTWYNVNWADATGYYWKQTPQSGYAMVASRAENKVAFIDLRPLFKYYRKMYMTTQANFDQTKNEGSASNQWPYAFNYAPEQLPVVAKVLTINQPTAVATGTLWNGFSSRAQYNHDLRKPLNTAYIASMDGTVRMYDVEGIMPPTSTTPFPDNPFKTFQVGKNPVQMFHGFYNTASDDLQIVSRGDRAIYYTYYDGTVKGVLRDSRLKDPVNVVVTLDQAGNGGAGAGNAVHTSVMTVMDFNGKQVVDYLIDDGWGDPEKLKLIGPNGESMLFQHGFSNPVNGYPFMFTAEEVL